MFRLMLRAGLPMAALACVLLVPQISLAQYQSYPGDWPQPGRGPGFGDTGFQRVPDRLPFPYDGINGIAIGPVSVQTPAIALPPAAARAFIRVRVAAGALVLFDGRPTVQTGTDRLFMSPPLEIGSAYSYQVLARWRADGKEREMTRTVRVLPGQTVTVDLAQ